MANSNKVFLPATPDQEPETTVSVLSYNVLAQVLVSRSWFPYCDKKTLKWIPRSAKIIAEIKNLDPDVACLQEVDQYSNFYRKQLLSLGYESVFYGHKTKKHGCCIAFKKAKYSLEISQGFDLDNESAIPCTFLTGNVLLLSLLKSLDEKLPSLVVGTCHLFWSPTGGYERLRQSVIVTQALNTFRADHLDIPTILSGDFNLSPNNIPYQAMTRQPISIESLKEMSNSINQDLESVKEDIVKNNDLIETVRTGVTKIKAFKDPGAKFHSNKFHLLMECDSEPEDIPLDQESPKSSTDSNPATVEISQENKTSDSVTVEISQENKASIPTGKVEIVINNEVDVLVETEKKTCDAQPDTKNSSYILTEITDGDSTSSNKKDVVCKDESLIDTLESLVGDLKQLKSTHNNLQTRHDLLNNLVPPQELINIIKKGPQFFSCYSEYTKLDPSYHSDKWSELNEPCFTNYTESFKSTLDYIFTLDLDSITKLENDKSSPNSTEECSDISNKRKFNYINQVLQNKRQKTDSQSISIESSLSFRLTPHQLLALPSKENLGVGFPNITHPSDHFPIMVRFRVDTSMKNSDNI